MVKLLTKPFYLIPLHDVPFDTFFKFITENRHLFEANHTCVDGEYERPAVKNSMLNSIIDADRKLAYRYAVILDNRKMIGFIRMISFVDQHQRSADLRVTIDHRYHRVGYGTQAVRRALQFAFNDLGFRKITATVLTTNTPGNKTLLKNNFRMVGIMTNHINIHGTWCDVNLYEVFNPNLSNPTYGNTNS
jgi:[ribosomal protein S5]-alanine N-acetyltransferase